MNAITERYIIVWCSELPRDSEGDADLDKAVMEYEERATAGRAVEYAKAILKSGKDRFGCIAIERQVPWRTHDGFVWWDTAATMHVDDAAHEYTDRDWHYEDMGE